jgi:hypothetical protein
MTAPALFDITPYLAPAAHGATLDTLSPDRRRTVRQRLDLAKGVHPLTGGPLHKLAAPHDDRDAAGHRCGTCRFRIVEEYRSRSYPKCHWPDGTLNPPYVTHGPASDVRAWWPACTEYQAEQP